MSQRIRRPQLLHVYSSVDRWPSLHGSRHRRSCRLRAPERIKVRMAVTVYWAVHDTAPRDSKFVRLTASRRHYVAEKSSPVVSFKSSRRLSVTSSHYQRLPDHVTSASSLPVFHRKPRAAVGHSLIQSVCEQDYCKSDEPISVRLGVNGLTNRKYWSTFGDDPVPDTDSGSLSHFSYRCEIGDFTRCISIPYTVTGWFSWHWSKWLTPTR